MAKGERILLCSDGLTNFLTDEEIFKTSQQFKLPEELSRRLVDMVLERGASDNVTAVVLSR